jgi:predicted  nucleic acid-binding Zn-ribbon protein
MLQAAVDGKSVAQVKQAGSGPKAEPDELEALVREEKRINTTIANLQRRLLNIAKRIEKLSGGGG